MPANRAILANIHELRLSPTKFHHKVDANGALSSPSPIRHVLQDDVIEIIVPVIGPMINIVHDEITEIEQNFGPVFIDDVTSSVFVDDVTKQVEEVEEVYTHKKVKKNKKDVNSVE